MKAYNIEQAIQLGDTCTALHLKAFTASQLPMSIFQLKNLQLLEIEQAPRLQVLNAQITQLSYLKILILKDCPLQKLNESIKGIGLEQLILKNNAFKETPAVIFKITSLKTLIYENNRWSDINAEPTFQLQYLSLRRCKLKKVPHWIAFQQISHLDLSYNRLNEIPDFIFINEKAKKYIFNNNQIQQLKFKNVSLQHLNLSNNQLEIVIINDELHQFTTLICSKNRISHFELKGGKFIHHLDLSANSLQKIVNPLHSAYYRVLNVSKNSIRTLPHFSAPNIDIYNLNVKGNAAFVLTITAYRHLNINTFSIERKAHVLTAKQYLQVQQATKHFSTNDVLLLDHYFQSKSVDETALITLLNRLRLPFLNQLFLKKKKKDEVVKPIVQVHFYGNFPFNKQQIQQYLAERQIPNDLQQKASHTVLGSGLKTFPNRLDGEIISWKAFLKATRKDYQPRLEIHQVEKVKNLLLSATNQALALQLIEGTASTTLFEQELMAIYTKNKKIALGKKAKLLLDWYGSGEHL